MLSAAQLHKNRSKLQLHASADNVALLAFAAERRPCSNRSISFCRRAHSNKPAAAPQCGGRMMGRIWTDGRTDGLADGQADARLFHRLCSAYCLRSVNKKQNSWHSVERILSMRHRKSTQYRALVSCNVPRHVTARFKSSFYYYY